MANKIFIAEDSPTQLEQLKIILEENNFEIDYATDGITAINKIRKFVPDLVISDIVMPGMDGYALCKNIKRDPKLKNVSVMLLTALSDPQDVIKGLESGADNFLTKPYDIEFLLSRIQYILVNKSLRTKLQTSEVGIDIVFGGKKYRINSDRMQIIDLLLSTYENAIQKNMELARINKELNDAHRDLAIQNRQLKKLNDDKNRFLRMAAHDIRNPVGLALSYSDLLLDEIGDKLDSTQKEFLSIIHESSSFVLKLLDELLDISVIESGKLNLAIKKTDLIELINRTVVFNKISAGKKNISITFEPPLDKLSINLDPVKIEQVINNLITNAIKYSHENTEVTLKLDFDDEKISVYVIDQGQGIPEEDIGKLFSEFGKTSVKSTAGERSIGLGLNIVKKIVEAHCGEVCVDTEVGKGSTFCFRIPRNLKPEE